MIRRFSYTSSLKLERKSEALNLFDKACSRLEGKWIVGKYDSIYEWRADSDPVLDRLASKYFQCDARQLKTLVLKHKNIFTSINFYYYDDRILRVEEGAKPKELSPSEFRSEINSLKIIITKPVNI